MPFRTAAYVLSFPVTGMSTDGDLSMQEEGMNDWMETSKGQNSIASAAFPGADFLADERSGDSSPGMPAREKYRALSRALGHVTYEHCLARNLTCWSEQCAAVFGWSPKEMGAEDKTWQAKIHREDRSEVLEEYGLALQEKRPFDLEYRFRHQKGHYLWVRDRGVPVAAPGGETWGIVGFLKDVTSQRQRDQDLRLAKRALESSINGIVLADLEGRLTYVNNSFMTLFGYRRRKQVMGTPVAEFWRNSKRALAAFRILRRTGKWSGHVAARKKDGSRLDVQLSAHVVKDRNGHPLGYMASFIDITDRREAERERQQSEKKYRLFFSSGSDAVLVFDAGDYSMMDVNPAAEALYGYSREEFLHLRVVHLAEDPEEALLRLENVATLGQISFSLLRHRRKDGICFDAEVSIGNFRWGNRLLMVAFVRDVTERQRIERIKDDLLSAVSHEMRTPLTAILGYTEYMLKYPLDSLQQSRYLSIIQQQSERLRELIENHLNLQRLRAGYGVCHLRPVEVRPLLHSVAGCFSRLSERHELVVECTSEMRPVQGDESQLHRALQNLVSNAVKYSPEGGRVTLGGCCEGEFITLFVRDEGIGIPIDLQERIFDRYFRHCPGEGLSVGGTGLGLALVKEIVNAHRGYLRVESSPGQGSTFYISLPPYC
jgi:PAS domain S-box-containing protein